MARPTTKRRATETKEQGEEKGTSYFSGQCGEKKASGDILLFEKSEQERFSR